MAELGNTLVGAVAGLEVQVGSPVVAEVLACICVSKYAMRVILNERILTELTGGAVSSGGDITGRHGGVETVSTHNLVNVGGRNGAGVDEGVETVNDNVRASESEHSGAETTAELGRRIGEGSEAEDSRPNHFARLLVLQTGVV